MPTDITNINNFFQQAKNQFQSPIYQKIFRTDPYYSLVKQVAYEMQDGLQPEVVTTTGDLPTAYPINLPTVSISNGTGNSCDITATKILPGNIVRNYKLEVAAWETNPFCLNDLQWDWKAAEMAKNFQKQLQEYARVHWSDWHRVKFVQMINTKISTLVGGIKEVSDSNPDFSGLAGNLPTAPLDWKHLDGLYDRLNRLGATPVGMAMGQNVFTINCGPGYKRQLFQTDALVRETVNYLDPEQNFAARGINLAINGFVPNVDDLPIRYKDDGVTPIYPTINVAATKGNKNIPNPKWLTVANGGEAVYEVVTVTAKDIFEVRVRPQGTVQFGDATFDPVKNYTGDYWWINNPDMANNTKGDKGFYRMEFQAAAKPIYPENGFAILTLAKD